MNLLPLPALDDNYFWLLHDRNHAVVVDPGEAASVLAALRKYQLKLDAILITHHHADHVGGVHALRDVTGAQVYGPAYEPMPEPLKRKVQGDAIELLGRNFEVIEVPGHTAGHVAYYTPSFNAGITSCIDLNMSPILFCGDTLFSGGCGRLFEGTPAQMLASLDKLAALPKDTLICCAHEYTLANLKFAAALEPDNLDLIQYTAQCQAKRAAGEPTLPSTIAQELKINPFLRSRISTVMQAIHAHGACAADEVSIFAALRQWKNTYQ